MAVNPQRTQKIQDRVAKINQRLVDRGIKKADPNSVSGLTAIAKQNGVEVPDTTPKLGILSRVGKVLGAMNPAEALLTGQEKGVGEGVKKYFTQGVEDVASGLTGKDYGGDRRSFSDVVQKAGIGNDDNLQGKIAKYGLGFVGDVLLDPSTYFGGTIVKGLGKVAGKGGSKALNVLGKVAPGADDALRGFGTSIKDAGGKAFVYGYKSSDGAVQDVLRFRNMKATKMADTAAENLNRLGAGVLSKDQSRELVVKLISGKRAEFAARESGMALDDAAKVAQQTAQSSDPVVSKLIKEQASRSKQMAIDAGIENPYETYFPFIKSDKLKKFLQSTNAQGIKVGSEAYKKEFRNLMTDEHMVQDPVLAFFNVESQMASDKMTKEFLNGFVTKYGKPLTEFKNSDEALSAGFKVLKEKGMFGKEIGYISKHDANLIGNMIDPEFQTVSMLAKATGYDAVTNLFKRSVTGLFAPFHVRNFVSGLVQNFEVLGPAALNPKNIAMGQKIAYKMARNEAFDGDMAKILKPFADRFSGDSFYTQDFVSAVENGKDALKAAAPLFSKTTMKETLKTAGLGANAAPFKVARSVGQFIEHSQKATAYVTAIGQGKSIDEALMLAEKAGFDYAALTKFESQIMRRLIPFYSFTRKNIELQLRTLGENPQRINQIMKFFENAGSMGGELTPEERKNLPSYLKDQFPFVIGRNDKGQPEVAQGFGTAVEALSGVIGKDANETVKKTLSSLNPVLKFWIERQANRDFFRDKPLDEPMNLDEYESAPKFIQDFLKARTEEYTTKDGTKVTKMVADPERIHLMRALPTSRFFNYLNDIYTPKLSATSRAVKLTTGVKPNAIDVKMQEYFTDKDNKEALEKVLIKAGILKRFERTYQPQRDNVDKKSRSTKM